MILYSHHHGRNYTKIVCPNQALLKKIKLKKCRKELFGFLKYSISMELYFLNYVLHCVYTYHIYITFMNIPHKPNIFM